VGYPAEAAARQRAYVGSAADGWFAEVLRSEQPLLADGGIPGYPDLGQPRTDQRVGLAVRVKGRPIAVLVAERTTGELPWHPSVFGILVRVAQLRLDLDLVRRKLGAPAAGTTRPTTAPPPSPPVVTQAEKPVPVARTESATTAPAVESPVAAATPAPIDEDRPVDTDPRFEVARRYARLVATDIRLYNEEAVLEGRRDGDLTERLQVSLVRGKETFLRRHGDLGPDAIRILREAFVEVLAGGRDDLISPSLLG
jgi:hypothetical protein